jgi:hypothetical protein
VICQISRYSSAPLDLQCRITIPEVFGREDLKPHQILKPHYEVPPGFCQFGTSTIHYFILRWGTIADWLNWLVTNPPQERFTGDQLLKLRYFDTSKIAERALLAGELSPQSCYILPYLSRFLHILRYGRIVGYGCLCCRSPSSEKRDFAS